MKAGGEKIYQAMQTVHVERRECDIGWSSGMCGDAKYDEEFSARGSNPDTARRALNKVIDGECQERSNYYAYEVAKVCNRIGTPIVKQIDLSRWDRLVAWLGL